MAETTGIAWATSTWNPWIGCAEVSPGCDNCYARALDARHRWGGAAHWGAGVPRYRTKDWKKPLAWNRAAAAAGERRFVFPSMCDPFDNEVPDLWRMELWSLIAKTPNLTWLLLTKRIGNVAKMFPWLPGEPGWKHVWIGASIVNQAEADRDIPKLLATPAAKRFVSYEPALGPVDFRSFFRMQYFTAPTHADLSDTAPVVLNGGLLHWVIVGGESSQGGVKARPFVIGWARDTVRQCCAAGVPVFVKQLGSNATNREGVPHPFKDRAGANPAEWPEDLRVQEIP